MTKNSNSEIKKIIDSVFGGKLINSPQNKSKILRLMWVLSCNYVPPKLKSNLNIALIIPYHPLNEVGGLEIGTMQIAKELAMAGQKVEIISKGKYLNKDLTGSTKTKAGIIVHGVGNGIEDIIKFLLKNYQLYDVIQWMEIFPPIPETSNIYNDKAEQQYLASVILRLLGRRVYLYVATSGNVTQRGTNNLNWKIKKQPFNGLLHYCFDGFEAANNKIFDEYKNKGINIKKSKFIPFGVDSEIFKPVNKKTQDQIRDRLGLPKNKLIIFFLGRFVARKNPNLLLTAWNKLPYDLQSKGHLVFIGGAAGVGHPDSIYKQMKIAIARSKNVSSFDVVPHVEMPSYIQSGDVLFFPSDREGWPLIVMEVMACGKTVFASNIPGIKEVIISRKFGKLINPNTGSVYKGLVEVLTNPDRYKVTNTAARKFVADNWGWPKIAQEFLNFYQKT